MKAWLVLVAACALAGAVSSTETRCQPTATFASGTFAPAQICSGDLIFSDEFNKLDYEKWQHEITLGGGGNWEFQYYSNNRTNSYCQNGNLVVKPTFMTDQYGEQFLMSQTLNIEGGAPADRCTNPQWWGCERTGSFNNIINPIKSARLRTVDSFRFKFGRVEVRAKMPAGDWLWPAIWLMPSHNAYGTWPASGEIDLMESRGNLNLMLNNVNIGAEQAGSTLHFGPYPELNGWPTAHWVRNNYPGYNRDFHNYQLLWTPDFMEFSINGQLLGRIQPGNGGFWEHGGFGHANPHAENPWRFGTRMAPFDEPFYLLINLAVGGTAFFPDEAQNNPFPKPWSNNSPQAATDFWLNRAGWQQTWGHLQNPNNEDSTLQVDYVRVWAL